MTYVFDCSPLSALFKNYYPKRFPSLWAQFGELTKDGQIQSTREVRREIEDGPLPDLKSWADAHANLFPPLHDTEGAFVLEIFKVKHFQQNIEQKKLMRGGYCADPFVIARAHNLKGSVVTLEQAKPNAAKIPNICKHFGVPCLDLEEFMEEEGWSF